MSEPQKQRALPQVRGSKFELSPTLILDAIRHWWWVCLPVGLVLGGISAGVLIWQFVPEYRAETMLRIDPVRQQVLPNERAAMSRQFVENQIQLVRSELVLEPLLSKPEIQAIPEIRNQRDKLGELAGRLDVSAVGSSDFYRISYRSPNAQDAALVANEVTESYLKLWSQIETERDSKVIKLLEEEKRHRKTDLISLQERLRSLTMEATRQDPLLKSSAQMLDDTPRKVADLQRRLTDVELDESFRRAKMMALREEVDSEPVVVTDAQLEGVLAEAPQILAVEAEIERNRMRVAMIKERAKDPESIPDYDRLNKEIEAAGKKIQELKQELLPLVKERITEAMERDRRSELDLLVRQLADLDVEKGVLKSEYEDEIKQVANVSSQAALDMIFAERELSRMEIVADRIGERLLLLKANSGGIEQVTKLHDATPPLTPAEKLPTKQLIMFCGLSLGLPFGLALLWEIRVRRVSHAGDVEQQSKVPVVGEIANLPVQRANGDSAWLFEESIDSLRTCLVLSEPLKDARVFAVTSAASQEGKTSVASQLAVSIARSTGELTLLVDGDMRSPDVHNVFHTELEPGLSQLLDGNCSLEDAVITDWSAGLHLLPAGQLHSSPHRLAGSGAFNELMELLRGRYRYIIVDTPPVLPASEALVMAKAADASLVCAMRNYSRLNQIRAVYDRLDAADANPVGVVLNGVPARRYAYSYGKYGYQRR